jgi:hypothetical protein
MPTIRLTLLCSLLLLLSAPLHARAQNGEAEVRAVVEALFDAMRAGDGEALRMLFHPESRLQTVGTKDGVAVLRTETVEEFVRAVAAPRDEVWDERISGFEARVDGDLATAWMEYRFYVGDRFSHCGVNAFQFVRTPEGWRITQLTDTRRREGCGYGDPANAAGVDEVRTPTRPGPFHSSTVRERRADSAT